MADIKSLQGSTPVLNLNARFGWAAGIMFLAMPLAIVARAQQPACAYYTYPFEFWEEPTNLVFTAPAGAGATPLSFTIHSTLNGAAYTAVDQHLIFTTSISGPNGTNINWLSVNPSSATTPSTISVSASAQLLSTGTYSASITTFNSEACATTCPWAQCPTVDATLTVGAPLPTITSVLNAASYANSSISPGEIVSIFGTNLGPTVPAGLQLDSTGKVATTLGGVQVLFAGGAAPLTYVSSTQINCVAPYEADPWVEVKYLGQTSNVFNLSQSSASPGIFTTNNGTGQVAALNADNTPNSTLNPATAGSVVQAYMTGGGQTSPAGVDGSVTCSAGCATTAQIPTPLAQVTGTVGGQPAAITFDGEAPGMVSGVLQVNVTIPPNTPPGQPSLTISVGGVASQAGVTVAVK